MTARTLWLFSLVITPVVADTTSVSAFRLPDSAGQPTDVGPHDSLTVVCFLGTECPLARLYGPRLTTMAREYPQVRFFGINSNRQDSIADLQHYVKAHGIDFALLKDHGNRVADQFQAERTPEVFLLDAGFRVRYRGRIDDQYIPGVARKEPTRHDLKEALQELLDRKPVSVPRTNAAGCIIGRQRAQTESGEITYCDQVARILQRHCVECHRADEIGPFRLDDYEEVVGWADTMLEVIDEGRMPPWHANPAHGRFQNARHMPHEDKQALRAWVESGMPYGNADRLPQPIPRVQGWNLPQEPDLVLTMNRSEFAVPADGTVEYQYFVVDPKFEEDHWVTAAQIVPGNHRVVHHSIVFVRPPDGASFRGIGWLAAYVPGARVAKYPVGAAVRIPAGSKLVFQQHYTPVGTDQSDLSKLGLVFGNEQEITHEIYTLIGIDQDFEIPPHTSDFKVRLKVPDLPADATLLSSSPHMHLRGKAFRLFCQQHGNSEILLDVPRYDFNWQHNYRFQVPIPLQNVESLEFDVTFDNSEENPVNPNPAETVTWGDQTWEEMAVAFFEVSEPRDRSSKQATRRQKREPKTVPASVQQRMKAEADRIMAAFDRNKDGIVERDETPIAFRRYAFWEIDQNRDRKLTRGEIEASARWRVAQDE